MSFDFATLFCSYFSFFLISSFICHICKEEFEKMCFLSRHCRKVHCCLPQVNCFCGKQLGTWKRLLIHKQLHFPEKIDYECKECKLIYKLKTSFENHMKSKHGPEAKKFVCSQCAREKRKIDSLKTRSLKSQFQVASKTHARSLHTKKHICPTT